MSEIKHTPGPWIVESNEESDSTNLYITSYVNDKARRIADIPGPDRRDCDGADEYEANARLIAAAPDLLAACKKMKSMYAFYASSRLEKQILQEAEDAIIKTFPK